MKLSSHNILWIGFLSVFCSYCFPVAATSLYKSGISTDTLRWTIAEKGPYGYWQVLDDTVVNQDMKKKWNILGLKIPAYVPPKRMDRDIITHTFIPKGMWTGGLNIAYYEESTDNYNYFFLEDWEGSAYSFNISPFFCYHIKDDLGIGARFTYSNFYVNIDNMTLSLGDDISMGIENAYIRHNSYQGEALLRSYVGLDKEKRFGLFNETFLSFGGGKGKLMSGSGQSLNDTQQKSFEMQLGIRPGLDVFVTNTMFIEAYFKVAGIKYKYIQQELNGNYAGSRHSSGINFKIDILSVFLGIGFCL